MNDFIAHDQRQIRQNDSAGAGVMQGLSAYIIAIEQTDWTPPSFLLSFSLSFHRTVTNDRTEISKFRHLLPNLYYALQAAAE